MEWRTGSGRLGPVGPRVTVTTTAKSPPAVVLLVEDDLGDQLLTQEAFRSLKVPYELRTVADGKEALEYLYHKGHYLAEEAPRPDLILLDLNMPRVNGQQVASVLHADPQMRTIPVVVLTTSRRQEDVVRAYSHGVTSYLGKPLDFQHFVEAVQELEPLIKLILSLKNLSHRRLTDRQVFRMARRMRQLERRAERLFNQYMDKMSQALAQSAGSWPDVASDAESGPALAHQVVRQLSEKIIREHAPGKPAPVASAEPSVADPGPGSEEGPSTDLFELARHLNDLADRPRRRPLDVETEQAS